MNLHSHRFMLILLAISTILLSPFALLSAQAVTLERIISQENPSFGIANARMSVGRDGKVYLVGTGGDPSYALKLNRDGSGKSGGYIGHAARFCTANSKGIIASVNTHLDHAVRTYQPDFKALWSQNDFPRQ